MFVAYQQIQVGAAVKDASAFCIPAGAAGAMLQAETRSIRYRMDNGNPTQTAGMILLAGDWPKEFLVEDIARMRFCQTADGPTVLNVHFFGGQQNFSADPGNLDTPIQTDFLAGHPRPW